MCSSHRMTHQQLSILQCHMTLLLQCIHSWMSLVSTESFKTATIVFSLIFHHSRARRHPTATRTVPISELGSSLMGGWLKKITLAGRWSEGSWFWRGEIALSVAASIHGSPHSMQVQFARAVTIAMMNISGAGPTHTFTMTTCGKETMMTMMQHADKWINGAKERSVLVLEK